MLNKLASTPPSPTGTGLSPRPSPRIVPTRSISTNSAGSSGGFSTVSSGSSGGSARREAGAVVPDEVSRVLFAEQLLILLAACCVLISVLIFFWRNPNALLFFVGVKILAIVFALRTARDGLLGSVWGLSAGIRQGILLSEEAQQSIYDVVIITSIRRMRMAKKLIRVVLLLTNRDLTREEIHYIIQNDQDYLELFRNIVGTPLIEHLPPRLRRLLFGEVLEREFFGLDFADAVQNSHAGASTPNRTGGESARNDLGEGFLMAVRRALFGVPPEVEVLEKDMIFAAEDQRGNKIRGTTPLTRSESVPGLGQGLLLSSSSNNGIHGRADPSSNNGAPLTVSPVPQISADHVEHLTIVTRVEEFARPLYTGAFFQSKYEKQADFDCSSEFTMLVETLVDSELAALRERMTMRGSGGGRRRSSHAGAGVGGLGGGSRSLTGEKFLGSRTLDAIEDEDFLYDKNDVGSESWRGAGGRLFGAAREGLREWLQRKEEVVDLEPTTTSPGDVGGADSTPQNQQTVDSEQNTADGRHALLNVAPLWRQSLDRGVRGTARTVLVTMDVLTKLLPDHLDGDYRDGDYSSEEDEIAEFVAASTSLSEGSAGSAVDLSGSGQPGTTARSPRAATGGPPSEDKADKRTSKGHSVGQGGLGLDDEDDDDVLFPSRPPSGEDPTTRTSGLRFRGDPAVSSSQLGPPAGLGDAGSGSVPEHFFEVEPRPPKKIKPKTSSGGGHTRTPVAPSSSSRRVFQQKSSSNDPGSSPTYDPGSSNDPGSLDLYEDQDWIRVSTPADGPVSKRSSAPGSKDSSKSTPRTPRPSFVSPRVWTEGDAMLLLTGGGVFREFVVRQNMLSSSGAAGSSSSLGHQYRSAGAGAAGDQASSSGGGPAARPPGWSPRGRASSLSGRRKQRHSRSASRDNSPERNLPDRDALVEEVKRRVLATKQQENIQNVEAVKNMVLQKQAEARQRNLENLNTLGDRFSLTTFLQMRARTILDRKFDTWGKHGLSYALSGVSVWYLGPVILQKIFGVAIPEILAWCGGAVKTCAALVGRTTPWGGGMRGALVDGGAGGDVGDAVGGGGGLLRSDAGDHAVVGAASLGMVGAAARMAAAGIEDGRKRSALIGAMPGLVALGGLLYLHADQLPRVLFRSRRGHDRDRGPRG